jgi:hypothetical protein
MITFPPARFNTDDPTIVPYVIKVKKHEIKPLKHSPIRSDYLLYSSGFNAISGIWFRSDSGIFLRIIDATANSNWFVKRFYWDGQTRRLKITECKDDRANLLAYLTESWPYEGKQGDSLYDEAEHHLERALKYDTVDNFELISNNFSLLLSNADRILQTPSMVNGALGDFRMVFVYLGVRRFPVSALLNLWKQGKWIVPCSYVRNNRTPHNAYVLSGGGGLSNGALNVYCPTCNRLKELHQWSTSYFTDLDGPIPTEANGLRLDEIIDELKVGLHIRDTQAQLKEGKSNDNKG